MTIQPNVEYKGLDGSNWDGPITAAEAEEIAGAGYAFAIVRLNLETPTGGMLSVQQCEALRGAGVAVFGYVWCYWWQNPAEVAAAAYGLARKCGVRIVALDAEDTQPEGVNAVSWLRDASTALVSAGIMALGYTYSYWPSNNGVDLSPLGQLRWWIANKGRKLPAERLAPYAGARVVGQQYSEWADGEAQAFDVNWFIFDAEMAAILNGGVTEMLTEEQVRAIVRDEVAKMLTQAGQGDDLAVWVDAVSARLAAASAALNLNLPIPAGH